MELIQWWGRAVQSTGTVRQCWLSAAVLAPPFVASLFIHFITSPSAYCCSWVPAHTVPLLPTAPSWLVHSIAIIQLFKLHASLLLAAGRLPPIPRAAQTDTPQRHSSQQLASSYTRQKGASTE